MRAERGNSMFQTAPSSARARIMIPVGMHSTMHRGDKE